MSVPPYRGGQAKTDTPNTSSLPNAFGHSRVTPPTTPPANILRRSLRLQLGSPASKGTPMSRGSSSGIYDSTQLEAVFGAAGAVAKPRKGTLLLSNSYGTNAAAGTRSQRKLNTPFVAPNTVDSVASEEAAVPTFSELELDKVCVIVRVRPKVSKNMMPPCCRVIRGTGIVEYTAPLRESPALVNTPRSVSSIVSSRQTTAVAASHEGRRTFFTYNAALGESANQNDTMVCVGYKMLRHLQKGYNATILCYGQSGSGKTHSMIGPAGGVPERLQKVEDFGLMPRMLEGLFTLLQEKFPMEPEKEKDSSDLVRNALEEEDEDGDSEGPIGPGWYAEIGALELYQEEMRDLLAECSPSNYSSHAASVVSHSNSATAIRTVPLPTVEDGFLSDAVEPTENIGRSPHPRCISGAAWSRLSRFMRSVPSSARELRICEDPSWGVAVSGLSWHPVSSFDAAMQVLLRATRMRRRGSTSLNERSSRSHFFLFVALQQWGVEEGAGGGRGAGAERRGQNEFASDAG
ncbi:putative kinesin [Trypanosoma rangeli]|uniref:Putative kinesin n=1 Tax=Trypanosoma rangeli TaxID=5698 RepID=A0A422NJB9_TRYRA|nr:putative kinesin [Trypanosoma rangeli]RNF05562.1 putative kinesin [Trypanosoma rangeli]|eukprot:RNF05562.1 putative kinesin [Trypanosoma rangeli]